MRAHALVRATEAIEQSERLDPFVTAMAPAARALLRDPRRADALRGMWLGHAVHPLLTDVPLGMWTASTALDVVGGEGARPAARRLIGLGLLAAVPTAVTGLAEWGVTGRRERRVGVVHAAANTTALGLFAVSWRARRRSESAGRALALAGYAVACVGGYFGGHLTEVRKVASHHPAFDDAEPVSS